MFKLRYSNICSASFWSVDSPFSMCPLLVFTKFQVKWPYTEITSQETPEILKLSLGKLSQQRLLQNHVLTTLILPGQTIHFNTCHIVFKCLFQWLWLSFNCEFLESRYILFNFVLVPHTAALPQGHCRTKTFFRGPAPHHWKHAKF